MDVREIGCRGVWSGFTWLRIGTVGGLLWMRWWTFGFWRHGLSNNSEWHAMHNAGGSIPRRSQHRFYIIPSRSAQGPTSPPFNGYRR
jgi:hypothetical protein